MVERAATILGGLPVIADVDFGKDPDTPNGAGEYWAEVRELYWTRKDGSKGKALPRHLIDRAEVYDPYFSTLIDTVSESLAYEALGRAP